jgi:hypothetical protein
MVSPKYVPQPGVVTTNVGRYREWQLWGHAAVGCVAPPAPVAFTADPDALRPWGDEHVGMTDVSVVPAQMGVQGAAERHSPLRGHRYARAIPRTVAGPRTNALLSVS